MSTVCPHCFTPQARSGQRYCGRCGATLATTSPTHGTPPLPGGAGQTVRVGHGSAAQLIVEEHAQRRDIPLGTMPLTIGRADHNQIVLVSGYVSAAHARIEAHGTGHCIVDVGSTNGLLFQGQRLPPRQPHELADGDVLRIGDSAGGSFVTLTYINPNVTRGQMVAPIALPLPGGSLVIGRGQHGNWNSPQVSRRHACIECQVDNTYRLRDLGSTNGTYVNGQRVQSHLLRQGDSIQIGPFRCIYTGTALIQQDQRRSMRIVARDLLVERPDERMSLLQQGQARARGTKLPPKRILQNVSLCIEPGEFVALVGGSGAGKSTLMGALSGFARATSGAVEVNGDDFYRHFDAYRSVVGYVPQDDIIHRMLPVARALGYAARLRLPDDTAAHEIAQRITQVLRDVEMHAHQATLVNHLSGGQRKRISIGSELLADPSLFFLDEPTSGLDPGLEKKMMYTLRRLADGGRTVVLVTHATANIEQCDLVAFLAAGRLVYYGPPREAGQFFSVTSGDFADIYTRIDGCFDANDPAFASDAAMQQTYRTWQTTHQGAGAPPLLAELWEMRFRSSLYYRRYVQDRLDQSSAAAHQSSAGAATSSAARVSAWAQFTLLARRYSDLIIQDRRNLAILLLQAPLIAILLAGVVDAGAVSGSAATFFTARAVMFMLAMVAVWFGIINAAREITKEATIYRRERLANLRIGPYLFSKVVVLTGLILIQSIMLLAIVGWKVHLPQAGVFTSAGIELFLTTFLAGLAGLAMGLLISTIAATPDRAISIVPLALIPQIILSGVIFTLEGHAKLLSWLAVGRWAMDAYGTVINLNSLPAMMGGQPVTPPYDEYTHSAGHLLGRWLIMALYTAVCLALTIWLLRRKDAKN